jgi:hypothetical protein
MKIRGEMSAVIEGLHKEHGLLAAFLEATDKIDWRSLHKQVPIAEAATPVNLEAGLAVSLEALPAPLDVLPASHAPKTPITRFAFRRANLVRASK